MEIYTVNGKEYKVIRLLGKGKGGYSYLAEAVEKVSVPNGKLTEAGGKTTNSAGKYVVLKQIHHEPCSYYTFGNKIEAEANDYKRLLATGIRIPKMIDIDMTTERIVKEYIEGDTIYDYVKLGRMKPVYINQVREMSVLLYHHNLNIDYFPTNFVVKDGLIYYIDYECNEYMEEWDFDHWGIKYWSRTKEFLEYEANKN